MHRPPVQRTASICLATLLALALLPCWPLEATAASVDVASSRPAWIHWIGWSTDSRFAAWRQGHSRQTNTPGKPVWLARAQPDGRLSAASRSHGPVRKALEQ